MKLKPFLEDLTFCLEFLFCLFSVELSRFNGLDLWSFIISRHGDTLSQSLHPSSRSILMPCPRAGRLNAVLSPYVMSRAKYFPIRPQLTESIYFIWLLLLRLLLCITSRWTARLFPAQLERSLADLTHAGIFTIMLFSNGACEAVLGS